MDHFPRIKAIFYDQNPDDPLFAKVFDVKNVAKVEIAIVRGDDAFRVKKVKNKTKTTGVLPQISLGRGNPTPLFRLTLLTIKAQVSWPKFFYMGMR